MRDVTDLQLEIRPVDVLEDFASIAAVINDVSDWSVTVEDLERDQRNHDPKYHWQRFVAKVVKGDQKRVVGVLSISHELFLDVPMGLNLTLPSFERWSKDFLENPANRPEAVWIAIKGDEWVGINSLEIKPGYFCIGFTGIKKAFRGLGIAKRLKLEGVRYALNHGALEIRTFNDHVNAAMLAMNFSMGFQKYRSSLRFERPYPM